MKTLREYIQDAVKSRVAIGHFNISNLEGVHAVFNSAKKLGLPVIIGVSEGERDFVGVAQISAIVKSLREEFDYPIFLNADHSYSFERVKTAIDFGFDAVIFDGTKLSFEENIKATSECVAYAKGCGRDVIVEAELGYIGQSSKVLDRIPDGISMTTIDEASEFVVSTGIDMLAPAVGNIHGMLKSGVDPELNIKLIKGIKDATGLPLVLHGASGNSDEDIKNAIQNGVAIVHINTELRVAYKNGLQKALSLNPEEVAPYKYLKVAMESMEEVVTNKLKIYNNI
jgi:fructose-bisphosphate aldolase, class II